MTKESEIKKFAAQYNWDLQTLERISNDVFFKQDHDEVAQSTDAAFIALIRSDACDDIDFRNKIMDSWFSTRKALEVINTKELPDNIETLKIYIDF